MAHVHGLYYHPLYAIWISMKQRCFNLNHPAYARYGGRGITVCDRWRDSFAAFLEDMGERPEGLTLERKDNNKGYDPENCEWASRSKQAKNRSATGTHMTPEARESLRRQQIETLRIAREAARIKPKPCKQCGRDFVHWGGKRDQEFCNRDCYTAYRRLHSVRPMIPCAVCGILFVPYAPKRKTCSKECAFKRRKGFGDSIGI